VVREEVVMDDDIMSLAMSYISMPLLAVLSWCCTLPLIIVYGTLVALRTRWTVGGLASDIPALLVGVVTAILAIGFPVGILVFAEGAHVTAAGVVFFGILFLVTSIMAYGASFAVIECVVRLTRYLATRARARSALSGSGKTSG